MSEKISSLFDNEVEQESLDKEVSALSAKSAVQRNWKYYQVVRDVLQNNYSSSPDLSARIMEAIDKEPTQMGAIRPKQNTASASALVLPVMPWKIAAYTLGVFVAIGIFTMNIPTTSNGSTVQLVQEDIPAEFMEKHFATTALNGNYFIKAQFQVND
jgi:negative regulator of sigma E activity